MDKIKYAVVGLGIGMAHVEGVLQRERQYNDVSLVAVCDLLAGRREKALKKSPDTHTYESFDEMLDCEQIDILSVCTPSGMHADFAVKAAERGINLLIEKPVDISHKRADIIRSAVEKSGVKAGLCHQNRKNAVITETKKALDEGRFGRLCFGTFSVKWYREQNYYNGWHGTWDMDGGGSLINQGIHTLDLMRYFFGEAESVTSISRIYGHDIETEDFTSSQLTFADGKCATLLTTTCAYPGICTEISLYGTDGTVELDGDVLKTWKFKDKDDGDEMLAMYSGGNASASVLTPSLPFGHSAMIYDIIDAVKDNREPFITLDEGVRSLDLVLRIYKGAFDGNR